MYGSCDQKSSHMSKYNFLIGKPLKKLTKNDLKFFCWHLSQSLCQTLKSCLITLVYILCKAVCRPKVFSLFSSWTSVYRARENAKKRQKILEKGPSINWPVHKWRYYFFLILNVRLFRNVFLVPSISSKKRTKTLRIVVKTNSFVHFLEESTAWQFAFEIIWPLAIMCP